MKSKLLLTILLVGIFSMAQAQFHTLNIPQASPLVKETQKLGVTDITVEYSSPAVRGRKVYENVIPKGGKPIAWRAGANMNTTISFSTDVLINGQALKAGTYGFHTIPNDSTQWQLIFAHASQQWGSYYLDREKDVSLEVNATPVENHFVERLNYSFQNRTDSTLQVAIEWENKRIPFTVEVDLNKTVLASLKAELRGINTYHWQAWSDAARWCLDRNTNLEEALAWANRSINGGFGGFAANKNMTNLALKSDILYKMDSTEAAKTVLVEALTHANNVEEMYSAGMNLIRNKRVPEAVNVFEQCVKKYPEVWFPYLGQARALSQAGEFEKAIKSMEKAINMSPENYLDYLKGQKEKLIKKEKI
jgi:tetratricopeptide (TPR) repeat protein